MNQYSWIAFLIVGIFIIWKYILNPGAKVVEKINFADTKERLDNDDGIIILDVRSKDEYLERHIPKSTLIPVDVLNNEAGLKLPNKNADIYVYCRSGARSSMAIKILTKLGYTHLYNLGGIARWPYKTVSGNK